MKGQHAKYYMEFLGTFFLMCSILFTGGLGLAQPLAIGVTLIALMNIGLPISGAHYNPAISIAMFIRGGINTIELIYYIATQIAATIIAAIFYLLVQQEFNALWQLAINKIIIGEVLGTLGLIGIFLFISHPKFKNTTTYIGLTVGLGLIGLTYAFAPLSAAIFNPAVAIGFAVSGNISIMMLPIYISISCVCGAAISIFIKRIIK